MGWIYLLIAAVFEVGWPLGLKMASVSSAKVLWIIFSIIVMGLSGVFLYFAQKEIPVGTAYAIWTGIGASCTFLIGVIFFHDTLSVLRVLALFLIIAGVIMLKIAH